MALSSMVSKASPAVVPLALRSISCATGGSLMHGSIISCTSSTTAALAADRHQPAAVLLRAGAATGIHQFSTVATAKKLLDTTLLKVLRNEIKSAKKNDFEKHELPKAPSVFPFTITDNPGERSVTLSREFPDETIEVKVKKASLEVVIEEEDEDGDDGSSSSDDDSSSSDDDEAYNDDEESGEENSENESDGHDDSSEGDNNSSREESESCSSHDREIKKEPPSLPLSVSVCKKDGRRLHFEIDASVDEIKVKHMSIEEYAGSESDTKVDFTGPDFGKLDYNLQHSLLKFLEIRGIKFNLVTFLHKYMIAKSHQDDQLWLNKLKKFVKK